MKRVIFLITFCCLMTPIYLVADGSTSFQDSERVEPIVDVDYGFFMSNPKIPWGSDPFHKDPGFITLTPIPKKFQLQGVAYQGEAPSAIVDGKAVRLGDKIGDRRVVEIGRNFVVLEKGNSQIELVIPPSDSSDSE